jgi:hypothetical protein
MKDATQLHLLRQKKIRSNQQAGIVHFTRLSLINAPFGTALLGSILHFLPLPLFGSFRLFSTGLGADACFSG